MELVSNPAADSRQFFLGIGGSQTGPFSEQEILDQISQGQVPSDALVWFEGLPDWQPIGTIEYFRDAVASAPSGDYAPPPPPTAPAAPDQSYGMTGNDYGGNDQYDPQQDYGSYAPDDQAQADYGGGGAAQDYTGMGANDPAGEPNPVGLMSSDGAMNPVFASGGGGGAGSAALKKLFLVLVGVGTLGVGGVYVYNEYLADFGAEDMIFKAPPKQPTRPRITPEMVRQQQLQQAQSELLLKGEESERVLKQLIEDNQEDAVGKQAIEALLQHYKLQRRNEPAGFLLMKIDRPLEASQFFLADPPNYAKAEEALFEAFKKAKGPTRADLLLQNIRINISKLQNLDRATERIRMLKKESPGSATEFSYYLKSPAQKIEDLYNRLSFYFVQQLLLFVESEFPQLSLVDRPTVSIEREGRKYRIVGRYRGEVILKQDRLRRIVFKFWLDDLNWVVVETNLTPERRKWANGNRRRLDQKVNTEQEMLKLLEALFQRQYPSKGIHEAVEPASNDDE